MTITIERYKEDDWQTLGRLTADDYTCDTLELPWRNNERNISRIPPGRYECVKRQSIRFGDHFHIRPVPERSLILIHHGNYHSDTKGCILVGEGLADIDQDGHMDVTNSRKAMQKINDILPDHFMIEVKDVFPNLPETIIKKKSHE